MARPSHLPEHLHPTYWTATEGIDFIERRDPTKPFFSGSLSRGPTLRMIRLRPTGIYAMITRVFPSLILVNGLRSLTSRLLIQMRRGRGAVRAKRAVVERVITATLRLSIIRLVDCSTNTTSEIRRRYATRSSFLHPTTAI